MSAVLACVCLCLFFLAVIFVMYSFNTASSHTADDSAGTNTNAIKSKEEVARMDRSTAQDEIQTMLARFGYAFHTRSYRVKYQAFAWYRPQEGIESEEIIRRIEADPRVSSYFKALVRRRDYLSEKRRGRRRH